jgi:hypothetical protein
MTFFHIFVLCLLAMTSEQPFQSHTALALTTTAAIMQSEPLSSDPAKDVASIIETMTEESSLNTEAIGDHGRSFGPMQILNGKKLSTVENIKAGIEQIRISREMCKAHPYAAYLGGPHACDSTRLQRTSDYRERRIEKLYKNITSNKPEEIATK